MSSSSTALTPRQAEIMAMLAEGKSNKEIARQLKVLDEARRTARQSWLLLRQRPPETPEHRK